MAYISHSPVREHQSFRDAFGVASSALVVRSAVVAIAAAVAVLALSHADLTTAAPNMAMAKADRMVAPQPSVKTVSAGFVNDPASATTTVERGAVVPLSKDSPLLTGAR